MEEPVMERVQTLAVISRSAPCCRRHATRAPTANPPISAQLEGTPYHSYHSPSYIRVRAVLWECGRGQTYRDTDTHTQTAVTTIHFASSTTQIQIQIQIY